ncbi:MAG TPA: copper chaperone PCu(A)C [Ramlibacter sp.]|nr:copper chaperone PCu(A)C [Ramlibacter sp.]
MKKIAASLLLAGSLAAAAQSAAPVAVQGAWARPTVKGQDATGAYMTLTAREPLTLVGADSPAAKVIEIHEMKMVGDVMKMRAAGTLPLAKDKPLQLAPGGYHFMLMDLKAPLAAGSTIPMTLRFRDAAGKDKALPVQVPVSLSAPAGHHHKH